MVLLHTNPLARHHTMTDYANMLVNKFIAPYYKAGAMEVHIVFDDPDRHGISPKTIERLCRDGQGPETLGHGQHSLSLPTLPHYSQWQNVLKCRQCKRSITESLASSLLTVASQYLPPFGKFVTAGAFTGTNQDKCLSVYAGCPEWKEEPTLQCNAEEADTRVWLHCKYSAGCNKIVFSQDTDTYHIGMGLLTDCRLSELDIYVQLQWSHVSKATNRFVHLPALQEALINDPDLAHLPNDILLPCLQTLYVVSGCDYVSFFAGIGKVTFLDTFYQHANFINDINLLGTLADIMQHNEEHGFLAFLRLIGSVYFKRYKSAFAQPTPAAYFHSISENLDSKEHHMKWINSIRATIWPYTQTPEDELPSTDSLQYHWKRSMWTANTWRQALKNTMEPLAITHYGKTLMWYGSLTTMCIRQGKEYSSTLKVANVKQTVQGGVDVLGTIALVGQDVFANRVCVRIHTALETMVPAEILALILKPHQVLIPYLQVRRNL